MIACDTGIFEEGEVAMTSTHGRDGLAALFEGVGGEKLLVLDSVGDTSDVTLACGGDGASSTPLSPKEFLLPPFGEGKDGETELMLDETLKEITMDITSECRVILVENLKSMLAKLRRQMREKEEEVGREEEGGQPVPAVGGGQGHLPLLKDTGVAGIHPLVASGKYWTYSKEYRYIDATEPKLKC